MNLHFPNLTNTPPGGWKYIVPETNQRRGPYSNWPQLFEDLQAHYQATNYESPLDLFERVEKQICEEYPEWCGAAPLAPTFIQRLGETLRSIGHTFHAAHQCLAALVSHRAGSGERPNQVLANQRAATCAECPENGEIESCSHCNIRTLNSLVEKLVGTIKTPHDEQLKYCKVCHCNLRAKISTKHEAIWNHMANRQKQKLPETCWLVTENAAKEKSYEPARA